MAEEGCVGEASAGGGVYEEVGGGEGAGGGGGGVMEEGEGVTDDGNALRERRQRDGRSEAVVNVGSGAVAIV